MRSPLSGLDLLRGVAAFVVLAHHVEQRAGFGLFANGYLAVDMFFMISGFVMTLAYEPRLADGLSLRSFAAIRLARLYPLLVLGSLLGALLFFQPFAFVASLLLIPRVWGSGALFPCNNVQWSLLLEAIANAVHAKWLRRFAVQSLAAVIVVGALLLVAEASWYDGLGVGALKENFLGGFPRVVFSYASGIFLCRLYRDGRLPKLRLPPVMLAGALPAAIIASHFTMDAAVADPLVVIVLVPPLVIAAAQVEMQRRMLALATWTGKISYALYCIQMAVIDAAEYVAPGGASDRIERLLFWGAVALVTIALAHLATRYYDRPIRMLWRGFADKRREGNHCSADQLTASRDTSAVEGLG